MSIHKLVRIMVWAISDGVSTEFSFDLNTSPYWVGSGIAGGVSGTIVNWFGGASASSKFPPPVAAKLISGAVAAVLASPIVTVTVPVKPRGSEYHVTLDLLFA